jgi:hypothetical protein
MTGLRIGVAAGPAWLIAAMGRLQSHVSGNACSISQAGAAAFEGPQEFLLDWREKFRAARSVRGRDQRHPRPVDAHSRWRVLLHDRRRPADAPLWQ